VFGCHNPTHFSLNVDNVWTAVCVVFWSAGPHLGICIRLKASSSGLWRHHSFGVVRSESFCKLPPEKMRMSHVAQDNGAVFRKTKDINGSVGKNKVLFVTLS
jgi:hypothetical protein